MRSLLHLMTLLASAALTIFPAAVSAQSVETLLDELAAQHHDIRNEIAGLRESINALKKLAAPCGAGTVGQRFVVLASGEEVCDNTTGVIWEREPSNAQVNWEGAMSFCKDVLGEKYRLPGVKELISLVDYSRNPLDTPIAPVLPIGHPFGDVLRAGYWSSTPVPGFSDAWFVSFSAGIVDRLNKGASSVFVWRVRGGQG